MPNQLTKYQRIGGFEIGVEMGRSQVSGCLQPRAVVRYADPDNWKQARTLLFEIAAAVSRLSETETIGGVTANWIICLDHPSLYIETVDGTEPEAEASIKLIRIAVQSLVSERKRKA